MKKVGCVMALVGVVMVAGAIASFVMIGVRAAEARKVYSEPLEPGETTTTEPLEVSTEKACQVAVQIDVFSTSIDRGVGTDSDDDVQFEFPFAYKVLDEAGEVVYSEETVISSEEGTKEGSSESIGPEGGTARGRCVFDKFGVPAPGRVRVEAAVQPDTRFGAEAKSLELQVYDNVSRHAGTVGAGVALILLGPPIVVLGVVLFFIGLARGRQAAPPPPSQQSYDPGPPQRYAIEE